MLAILATLFSLYVTPNICQAPCYARWMAYAANEQPRGEMCIEVKDTSVVPAIDVQNSCRTLYGDEKDRFWSGDWRNLEKGYYTVQITLDGKVVSPKKSVIVSPGLGDREGH